MSRERTTNEVVRDRRRTETKTVEALNYRQIADVLTKVEGTPMTPRRVSQICRAAELKLSFALLADWDWCQRLRSTV